MIDGRLDEPAWRTAAAIALPFEVAPGDNIAAPLSTVCRIAHDRDRLYVGCSAEDDAAAAIRAYVTERDAVGGQDRIELTLVPFDDGRRGYRFVVTPLGLQGDAQVLPDAGSAGTEDTSWDAAWLSAGSIDGDGYAVELAIPFRELRFPVGADAWGVRITRHVPRGTELQLRSVALDRADACDLCQTARLNGLSEIDAGGALRLTPTLTTLRTAGDAATSTEAELGADVLWAPQPWVALGAALNPDFSHVEADAATLSANERFALQFPERRPVFLEGADLFATPVRVFFSRSIADPDAVVKVTAKRGRTAAGVIFARDARTGVLLPGPERSDFAVLGEGAQVAALRLRRDLGRASSVGVLATSRTAGDYANHVGSVDALLRPALPLTVQVQAVASSTEDPAPLTDGTPRSLTGAGANVDVRYATRDWIVSGQGVWRSDDLRLDAGFEPQVGVLGYDAGVRRELLAGRDAWYQRISIGVGGYDMRREEGGMLARGLWVGGEYEGPHELVLRAYWNATDELAFAGRTFRVPTLFTALAARPSAAVRISGHHMFGRGVDFAASLPADLVEARARLEARIGRRIDLSVSAPLRRLRRDGETVLLERAVELRSLVGIGARTSMRLIGQWSTVEHASVERADALLAQVLFAYHLDAHSVVRLGSAWRREGGIDHTALFLKIAYAWRP